MALHDSSCALCVGATRRQRALVVCSPFALTKESSVPNKAARSCVTSQVSPCHQVPQSYARSLHQVTHPTQPCHHMASIVTLVG